ncbi:MAG: sulfotransferase domain-containing protein, partial [Actinomycetota bacterium]|nr:sulfotransferase domain-containing protein [Actinomycetota bacterium]
MTRHLLVIGGQRCGTTYLYAMLEAHPDIAMARPARPEPKVFMSDELAARGLEWYRATYFAHATTESVLGEKSTSYLEDGEAAKHAASVLGAAEIVVQLRDPVARAVSNWRFSAGHGLEERPLAQALDENLQGLRDWDRSVSSVSPFAYLERGRYVDYLE